MNREGRRTETAHAAGPREMLSGGEWIYGRNPVREVLQTGRRAVMQVLLPPADKGESDDLAALRALAHAVTRNVGAGTREKLDKLTHFGHHQGAAVKVSPYPYADFAELAARVADDENATVVVLDHLEDPQNVGSILRTACAAGVTGVVIPEDRACGVTPAAVRASAGASEHLLIAKVVNLPRAMKALQEAGMWMTGLDWGEDARPYTAVDFRGRAGLVVGAEGRGISRLVRQTCDFIAELPMPGGFESLNAGVAAGVALYEMLRQRA